jgi:hypothetical protein
MPKLGFRCEGDQSLHEQLLEVAEVKKSPQGTGRKSISGNSPPTVSDFAAADPIDVTQTA